MIEFQPEKGEKQLEEFIESVWKRKAAALISSDVPSLRIQVSIPLADVRRPRDTEIWKLESAFRCRSCSTKRYKPPVHLIKLTKQREVALAPWYHPSEDDGH